MYLVEWRFNITDSSAGADNESPQDDRDASRQFRAPGWRWPAIERQHVFIDTPAKGQVVYADQQKQDQFGPEPRVVVILLGFAAEQQ